MRLSHNRSVTLADHLAEAPFTLCMSSGFFGFYAHAGMLAALIETGLFPSRVVGSSAGALVAGCHASGLSTAEIKDLFFGLRRGDFWDPGLGFGLLSGKKMDALLRRTLPIQVIEDLNTPFACSAYNIREKRTDVIDKGDLALALRASAALPFLFQPVRIGTEDYLDGGIADRPAFAALADDEKTLYHHLDSRAPYRIGGRAEPSTPRTVTTLNLGLLPRLGPFRLSEGRAAWSTARERTLRRLDSPLD